MGGAKRRMSSGAAAIAVLAIVVAGGLAIALGAWPSGQGGGVASATGAKEDGLRVQVITFNIKDMTEAELQKITAEVFVPALQKVPGLLAKVFLYEGATKTYGGVYTWRDTQSMEDYPRSELFRGFAADPHITNITVRTLDVTEDAALIIGTDGKLQ